MAFNYFLRAWALIPKWLLVSAAVGFFAYFTGISHGRAPYKLADKLQDATGKVIVKHAKSKNIKINEKVIKAHESSKNNKFNFSDNDAGVLSDILKQ